MTKQAHDQANANTIESGWYETLINCDNNPLIPDSVQVGSTIRFTTTRYDGTSIRSTNIVTGGNESGLTLKDYTGKDAGTLNVVWNERNCLTCWEGRYDALHTEKHKEERGISKVTYCSLEQVNGSGVALGVTYAITVVSR